MSIYTLLIRESFFHPSRFLLYSAAGLHKQSQQIFVFSEEIQKIAPWQKTYSEKSLSPAVSIPLQATFATVFAAPTNPTVAVMWFVPS
jgi:hypothetical protein